MLTFVVRSLWASTGGSVSGVVKDPTGGVIPRATVTALNTATDVKQTTTTDVQGFYSFPVLPVGSYEIEIDFQGFKPYRRKGLVLDVNSALEVDATLDLGQQAQTVTVTDAGPTFAVEGVCSQEVSCFQQGDLQGLHYIFNSTAVAESGSGTLILGGGWDGSVSSSRCSISC